MTDSEGVRWRRRFTRQHGRPDDVGDQVEKLRGRFGLERVVLVGDCGTLTPPQIANFISIPAWDDHGVEERRDSHSGGERSAATLCWTSRTWRDCLT